MYIWAELSRYYACLGVGVIVVIWASRIHFPAEDCAVIPLGHDWDC